MGGDCAVLVGVVCICWGGLYLPGVFKMELVGSMDRTEAQIWYCEFGINLAFRATMWPYSASCNKNYNFYF